MSRARTPLARRPADGSDGQEPGHEVASAGIDAGDGAVEGASPELVAAVMALVREAEESEGTR